jgi:hypothetical protein
MLRGAIQYRADFGDQSRRGRVLPTVTKVEATVEVGRIVSLRLLQNGLELVERLGAGMSPPIASP